MWQKTRNKRPKYYNFQSTFPLGNASKFSLVFSLMLVALSYASAAIPGMFCVPNLTIRMFVTSFQLVLFAGLPLVALLRLGGLRAFRDLGPRLKPIHIPWMVLYVLFTMFLALFSSSFVTELDANPIAKELTSSSTNLIYMLLFICIQLFFEELLAVLSFVEVYQLAQKSGKTHLVSIFLALVVSVVMASLVHLPTYNFNLAQVLIVIGAARLGLGICYAHLKNFWLAYLVHVLYDVVLLGITWFVASSGALSFLS
ncbi:MAG: CPBP family glutamic-type intramembrane protease [Coriobacteriia bacterium]|nr:CPBP family glutamic-type intramembrane protease [Coriobacteriia bacterium]